MESNHDEAKHCIEIALKRMNEGDLVKAEKFLKKAESLYPSERAKRKRDHMIPLL